MAGKGKKQWLSAAQCAARTGLTVRALRVYEREGLVAPVRSDKGWRRYGQAELERINTVVSLKALGLTLEQIRQVMAPTPPPLMQLLDLQIQALSAKRAAADRALQLLDAARARAASGPPSLEELCELIHTTQVNRSAHMQSFRTFYRRLVNELSSPEEERAWLTWWAEHPEQAAAARGLGEQLRTLRPELEQLAASEADPASPAAQALISRWHDAHDRHGAESLNLRLIQWNPSVAAKFLGAGVRSKLQHRSSAEESQAGTLSPRGLFFLAAAIEASPRGQAFRGLLGDVKKLQGQDVDPASPQADAAVARLTQICAIHGLGDPYAYVQRRRVGGRLRPVGRLAAFDERAEAFLACALESRSLDRSSDLSAVKGWLDALAALEAPGRVLERVPMIPLREGVAYPGAARVLFLQRPRAVQAAERAMRADKLIVLTPQRQPQTDDPTAADLLPIGTMARVVDFTVVDLRQASGVIRIVVSGIARAHIDALHEEDPLSADITVLADAPAPDDADLPALKNAVLAGFEQHLRITGGWPPKHLGPTGPGLSLAALADGVPLAAVLAVLRRADPGRLADAVANSAALAPRQKHELLKMLDVKMRLEHLDAAIRNLEPVPPPSTVPLD